jgi:hypothetical protein
MAPPQKYALFQYLNPTLEPHSQEYSAMRIRFLSRTLVFMPMRRGMPQDLQKRMRSSLLKRQL